MTMRRLMYGLLFLVGLHGAYPAAAEPPSTGQKQRVSFTAKERALIDDGALWSSREKINEPKVQAIGSTVEWLIVRTPLPAEEEQRRAAVRHKELLEEFDVSETPAAVQEVLKKLVAAMPERMQPEAPGFVLTVAANPKWDAFTIGGGHLYVSENFLETVLADDQSGTEQLAFVMAHELGHMSRHHARRRYQREWLQQELNQQAERSEKLKRKVAVKSVVGAVGVISEYVYTREEDFQADLFAIHLCRNSGFDQEDCLDALRRPAVRKNGSLLQPRPPRTGTPPVTPEIQPRTTGEEFTLASQPSAVHRLRRLRLELDGLVYGNDYGLFEFDPETKKLRAAADDSLKDGSRAVICIHGMESSLGVYQPLMNALAAEQADSKLRILGFQYPADDSLSRAGMFLKREIQRVCGSAEQVDFVCHSAGGLVFRYYAEVEQGEFSRAVFLATPHGGSNLSRLRPLLEVKQFVGDLKLGYDAALERAILDGRGQMTFDLQPESLFLRYLNRPRKNVHRDRYVIYRGRAFKPTRAFLLRSAVAAARTALKRSLAKQFDEKDNLWTKLAEASIDKLRIPDEIAKGDLAVTLDNAALDGVERIHTYPLKHTRLPRDPEIIKEVVKLLASQVEP